MNSRTTGSATSASSSAMRTSRSVSLTLSSVRRPRPLILRSVRDKRSVKLSNIVSRRGGNGWSPQRHSYRISPQYTMKPSLLLCNGWSCGHVTLYCFSFSLVNCRHNYARFALLALVAYSFSLALIVPGLLQKTAAGGVWLFFLRSSRWCAMLSRWNRVFCPAATVDKT